MVLLLPPGAGEARMVASNALESIVNAAVDFRRLEIQAEQQMLRDRLDIARQQHDYWKGKSPTEVDYWEGRIRFLETELRIQQGILRVIPGDGGPDEQRRLEAREDWKRERDEYA